MLHYLGIFLQEQFSALSFLRLLDSISFRAIAGAMTALLFTILFGGRIILYLYRSGHRDTRRTYDHFPVSGSQATKTYGGGLLVAAILLSMALWCRLENPFVMLCAGASVWFAALGYVDDHLKVRHGASDRGLSESAKLVVQFVFALAFALVCTIEGLSPMPEGLATQLYVPFLKTPIMDLGWGYVPFIVFTLIAISNSVNIADGVDGLAVVPVSFVVAVYGVFAYVSSHAQISEFLIFPFVSGVGEVAIICSIVFGACLGFLWFNSYPANVIMGDTGSMALGGLLGTVVVLVKQEFLFLVVGGIFVGEALSVVVQEKLGLKWLGRRFFLSAPIHHHFQARGLADTKIVIRFWILAGILALCGLATLKIR
ncbi:MAG: phospho-N-acetylmuramoyl-pentapeptide-transferase [Candidatus Latescibacterota bacterium]|nr:phospho-N-acetylmuramoyl-pentapeptide-transferase [Candidatus Latescibacterota bacterium]